METIGLLVGEGKNGKCFCIAAGYELRLGISE